MRPVTIGLILLVVVLAIIGCAAFFLMSSSGGDGTTDTADAGVDGAVDDGFGDYGGGDTVEVAQLSEEDAAATAAAASDQPEQVSNGNVAFENVVIALQDLPRGFRITPNSSEGDSPAIGTVLWPVSQIPSPQNSFDSYETLFANSPDGWLVRTDIPRESPILSTQLVSEYTALGETGSDAALLLPPGLVAISMPLDPFGIGQVAYGLQPGDYVDVIFSFLFIEVDEQFQSIQPNAISIITRNEETGDLSFGPPLVGRTEANTLSALGVLVVPQESQRPRLVTQRTVSRAYVLHVGYFPADGRVVGQMSPTPFLEPTQDPNAGAAAEGQPTLTPIPSATDYVPEIVTLGVEPQDALVLAWAVDAQIPVTYVLRSANDTTVVPTTAVTLEYIITNYSIPNPPILPFSIQPAITSIRRFDIQSFSTFLQEAVEGESTGSGVGNQQQ
jgi:Flp pilus assembly protein CpaB